VARRAAAGNCLQQIDAGNTLIVRAVQPYTRKEEQSMSVQQLVILTLILVTPCVQSETSTLPVFSEFRAEYIGKYKGLPARPKGIRELKMEPGGHYRFTSSASSMMLKVLEATRFNLSSSGVIPLDYQYKRSGVGKNRADQVSFDWQTMTAHHEGEISTLTTGTQDKLSYQLQLRLEVARLVGTEVPYDEFTLVIADRGKRREYRFRIDGEEHLSTPAGELRTIRVSRIRDNPDRITTFWLAADHEYMLVRLRQDDGDSGFELNLRSFKFAITQHKQTAPQASG
jgi:hypothetical protein